MGWYDNVMSSPGWLGVGVLCLILFDRARWQTQQVVLASAQGHRK